MIAKGLAAVLGAALLALSSGAQPQGRSDPWDPKRCDELQAKRAAVREACESKPPEERKACYREAVTR